MDFEIFVGLQSFLQKLVRPYESGLCESVQINEYLGRQYSLKSVTTSFGNLLDLGMNFSMPFMHGPHE